MAQTKHLTIVLAVATAFAISACGGPKITKKSPPKKKPTATQTRQVPSAGNVTSTRTASTADANNVVMRAMSLVGTPYSYGGNTPEGGFDCSGLVNYVYKDMLNLKLPRTSRDLAAYQGPSIAPDRLNTGDLVFFGTAGNVSHVGIYVGDGRFVHAPSTGGTVRMDRLDGPYWVSHYTGSKRILGR